MISLILFLPRPEVPIIGTASLSAFVSQYILADFSYAAAICVLVKGPLQIL